MRIHTAVVSTLSLAAASAAAAQVAVSPRITTRPGMAPMAAMAMTLETPRAVIGVSTSTGTGARDTLGLLVATVTRDGPAEKAGIEEGNRIASINGVNLKLSAADIDDPDMVSLMSRRLMRELDKVKPGDVVDLKVYGGGQTRTLKVKTVDPDDLYATRTVTRKTAWDDRATLGLGIGSSGSPRDTLGVFIMSVEEGGPAEKAGIEEGQRIQAINGVDVRVSRDDAGDDMVSSVKVSRLEREISKLKPGETADLKIWANGSMRTVKVTSVSYADLPRHGRSITIVRPGGVTLRRLPDGGDDFVIDGEAIGATVRSAIEKAQTATGESLEGLGRAMGEFGRGLNSGGTIHWFQEPDEAPTPSPIARLKPVPADGRTISRTISM